ncbi:hypothetical protein [Neptunomonas phycophila]|uniref:hypothetical protein n=1 Tax=Neptunomonas phycophila TaxID=1572645 RepID=UPI0035143344
MLEIDPQPNKRLHVGAQTYAINRHRIRRAQLAFHPDVEQLVLDMEEGLMCIMRVADSGQKIIALYNFTKTFRSVNENTLKALLGSDVTQWQDLLHNQALQHEDGCLKVKPYACHSISVV